MQMKEAFHYQNRLRSVMTEVEDILSREENVTLSSRTIYHKKVDPTAENQTLTEIPPTPYYRQIDLLVQFLLYLMEQYQQLTYAVSKAKASMPIDLDSEICLNKVRQTAAQVFRQMNALKGTEATSVNTGIGYRFNADGNQVSYRCDTKVVTTINFNRKKTRSAVLELGKQCEKSSADIERYLVTTEVDYEPPFDVNDSLDDMFNTYAEGL